MPKGKPSRKFISPPLKGDKLPLNEIDSGDKKPLEMPDESKLKGSTTKPLSDSQYEDIFSTVIRETRLVLDKKQSNIQHSFEDNEEEHNVAVPEPNSALSPAEEAEGPPREATEGSATKTPDQPTDNSILPPIKRKKPVSKISLLGLKLKPTRLNFDDPSLYDDPVLMGKPANLPKPKKSKSLHSKTSQKPKISSKSPNCDDAKRYDKPKAKKKEASKAKHNDFKFENKKEAGKKDLCSEVFSSPKLQKCPTARDFGGSNTARQETPRRMGWPNSQQSTDSAGNGATSLHTPRSSQLMSSQSSSIMMATLTPRSRLFRLQRKRNVGLWVQCTNKSCSKWRYLSSTRDPTEVPDNWQCFMNLDKKYASCSIPEKGPTPVEEEDLIHNIYTAGSVVWGCLTGYPWWPAIVDDDPDVEQYYWITETCDIPTHYNVTFFDDKSVTRAWLTPRAMAKYSPAVNKDYYKKSAHGVDYSKRIEVAKRQAEEALKLPIDERLKKFSFVARFKGPIGKKRYPSDSEDEVDKKSVKRAGKMARKERAGAEEDPMMDYFESLEVIKEVNQVLNDFNNDCESGSDAKSDKGPSKSKNKKVRKHKKGKEQSAPSIANEKEDKRKDTKLGKKKVKEMKHNKENVSGMSENMKRSKIIKKEAEKGTAVKKSGKKSKDIHSFISPKLGTEENNVEVRRGSSDESKQSLKKRRMDRGDRKPATAKDNGKSLLNDKENIPRGTKSHHADHENTKIRKETKKKRNKTKREEAVKKVSDAEKVSSSSDTSASEQEDEKEEQLSENEECDAGKESDDQSGSSESSRTENDDIELNSEGETEVDSVDEEVREILEKSSSKEEVKRMTDDDDSSSITSVKAEDYSVVEDSHPPFNGRSSTDLFLQHQCNVDQESANSRCSADFEVEE